jgi:hypothetical protein
MLPALIEASTRMKAPMAVKKKASEEGGKNRTRTE